MADNSYAQLIDDFEAGIQVLEGETLTEYIKRMGGVDYNAHGGSVGIEVLFNKKANGGRVKYADGGNGDDDSVTGISMSIEERWERIKKLLKQMEDLKKGVGIDPDPEDKAQGGRVGFLNGGWADNLEGEAKGIYDSMTAYGASDAEIQSKLQGQNLWSPDGTTTDTGQVTGIINQDITSPGGTGGTGAVTDFYESITERQNRLNNPGKIQGLINTGLDKLGINKQNSVQEMLSRGMLGPKDTSLTGSLPFGISGLLSKALPDGYGDMTLGDQITTQSFMGYTDPNTNMSNKDPFGLNVRSMFGNYVEKAGEIVDTLEAKLAKNGYLSPYDQQRFDHYKNVTTTKQNIAADLGLIEIAKKEAAKQNKIRQIQMEKDRKAGNNPSAGSFSSNSPGGISQSTSRAARTDQGGNQMSGWGLRGGGLATMFTRRR